VINIDSKQLQKHFADIPDPRGAQGQLHQLSDIILISILAVISGADDFTEIAVYGQAKEPWLKTFLELPNGIPSHDTFNACGNHGSSPGLKNSRFHPQFVTRTV
jgi:DDE_Tnp_1-associated